MRTAAMEVAGWELLLQQFPCLLVCGGVVCHCTCKHCWCVVANDVADVSSNELVVISLLPQSPGTDSSPLTLPCRS